MLTGGVHTRQELHASGLGHGAISRLLTSGRLLRVGRAQYVVPGVPAPIEAVLARPAQGAVLSHASAARVWGLPVDDERCHITVANGSRRRWVPAGVVVHQTRSVDAEVHAGVVVTSLERTLCDIAATSPLRVSLPVLDAGLRLGAVPAEL